MHISLALLGAATLFLAPGAHPQTNKKSNAQSSYAGLLSASNLKGAEVRNLQDEDIGDIEEVLLDPSSGKIRFAVVGIGGFLGMGETPSPAASPSPRK